MNIIIGVHIKFIITDVSVNFIFLNELPIFLKDTCINTKNSIIVKYGIIKYSE